jgi:ABC-type transport system involved in multi-copper enzyme maturation permease subunit
MAETTAPAPARVLPPAPGYLASAARVFDLSMGEMLWSRRTIFMALIVGAPVAIALILRLVVSLGAPVFESDIRTGGTAVRMTGPAIFGLMIWVLYLRFIVPVLGVFYGTSLMADEVEDKTITYLFVRPVRRGAVLVGKYLAYLACTLCVVLPSVVLVYLLVVPMQDVRALGGSFMDLLTDLGLLALGLAVYGAVFAFIGAAFRRPLLIGLVFIFGWEQAALAFPGYMKQLTVAYYLQALVPHALPADGVMSLLQGIFRDSPGITLSLLALAVIGAVFLALATWVVERREYVLEQ